MDYKSAGVDIEAGYRSVELMKQYVKDTFRPEVLTGLGGFSGAFSMKGFQSMKDPVLLSGTDGVGTKLKIAFLMDRHDTVGIDCVAMCVNDVACAGGEPLFFLDYIACGKNVPEKIADIVRGVAEGCKTAGCALIGGETAEMPGFYQPEEYDLAGFAVGVVDREEMITGSEVREGDILIGLASSGVHSNGYSLVRKALDIEKNYNVYENDLGKTLGEELLTPTKIYVPELRSIREGKVRIHGASHITGGGFYENVPRMLPDGLRASISVYSFPVPPIFRIIGKAGKIEERVMYNTFNMGIGMVLAVDKYDADEARALISDAGGTSYIIGNVVSGEKGVDLC